MKSVEIRYFALFREKAGKDNETLEVSVSTYLELYEYLSKRYDFGLPGDMIHLAVDDEFTHINLPIADKARIVFIPPVAGG
ncbi:MAG TPA: MoaD/ThiS family protein [Bacteriovoracaceae bacterium]|nr:MoaD/ThiS family protein [Bacteriovoracaceae bacterium]